MNTTQNLPAILGARHSRRYRDLIDRAQSGAYHDTLSPSLAPKDDLVHDLSRFPELADVLVDVKNGAFDERDAGFHICSLILMMNNVQYCSHAVS